MEETNYSVGESERTTPRSLRLTGPDQLARLVQLEEGTPIPPSTTYDQDLIDDLRKRFFEKYPTGHDEFDERDIPRVRKYDKYLYNILITTKSDVEKALEKLEKILRWRKEFEINDLTWDDFPAELREIGGMYCRGRDKENCRIVFSIVKHHKKGDPERQKLAKMFIAFWLEKLQWEDFDNPIVIVQDLSGAGVSNMDLDVVRFLIGCLELYFPALCNMLYMYEMPWILNAIWKVIERILSEESKAHLKFIKSRDVPNYFDADQLPVHMGGTDTYQWKWPPPEQFRDTHDEDGEEEGEEGGSETGDVKMQSVLDFDVSAQEEVKQEDVPGTSGEPRGETAKGEETARGEDNLRATENIPPPKVANDVAAKKVHFADEAIEGKENTDPRRSSTPTSTTRAKAQKKVPPKKTKTKGVHRGPLISTTPGESLIFKLTGSKQNPKEMKTAVSLSNTTDNRVAYKVKTTSPDKYRVRPSSGQINPGASVAIEIIYRGTETEQVVHDKFLIQSTEFGGESAKSTSELTEFWRKVSKSTIVSHTLRCICETPPGALVSNHDILKELHTLNKKVAKYDNEREKGFLSTKSTLRLIFLMQALIICLLVYMLYTRDSSGSMATDNLYSESQDAGPIQRNEPTEL